MAPKDPGYVYILTNQSFREDWVKIGMSSRPVEQRLKELDNTIGLFLLRNEWRPESVFSYPSATLIRIYGVIQK